MKTKLEQSSQSRLEVRDGILCIVVETALDGAASKAGSPAMVSGRPVRNLDPQEGLFVDEDRNSYRLVGGGQAKAHYAEVIPVDEGGPGTQPEAAAPMSSKQRTGNGSPV